MGVGVVGAEPAQGAHAGCGLGGVRWWLIAFFVLFWPFPKGQKEEGSND